jgi:uncharacterized membrane protein
MNMKEGFSRILPRFGKGRAMAFASDCSPH